MSRLDAAGVWVADSRRTAWFAAAIAATTPAARRQRIWSLRVVKPELAM